MKKKMFGAFIAGVLVTVLVIGLVTPVGAAAAQKVISVFTGVSVYVNDKKVDPKDANGKRVDAFIYNGTTYLPIRAIGESLGMDVSWDAKTKSAYIGKHNTTSPKVSKWFTDLDYYSGDYEIYTVGTEKDNTGASHSHSITAGFKRTYLLNGNYDLIQGTLYQTYQDRSVNLRCIAGLEIYGDGKLLLDLTENFDDSTMKPKKFSVNVTGVKELRVEFYSANEVLSIGDMAIFKM